MNLDRFYSYINLFPMPLWVAMMFFPRHPLTERASRSSTIFGLAALHYLVAFGIAMRHRKRSDGTAHQPAPPFGSLEWVRTLLGTRPGTTTAWAHMLALDLFTGAWIYRQCRHLHAPDGIRITALLGTLMAGPLGLLIFLIWRVFRAGKGDSLLDDSR